MKSDLITYVMIVFVIIMVFKIYRESDVFQLKCIISNVDGKSYWENVTPAPLPRREFSKRSDYNVTLRGNRHEITNKGWVHDQDNKKIQKDEESQSVLAHEKGYSTYTRVPDSECKSAVEWWKKNYNKWKIVRDKWINFINLSFCMACKWTL